MLLVFALFGSRAFGDVDLRGKMPEDLVPELREVISVALLESDTMAARALAEDESRGRKISARSAVLPSFNSRFSFRQERDDDRGEAGFEDRVVYSVVLSQPLYHWGSLKSEKKIGELQYEMQQLSTIQSAESLVSRVRRDYLALMVAKQRLEVSRLELEDARERYEFQQSQIEAGAASGASLLTYELNLSRDELTQLRNEADYLKRLGELAQFVSMDRDRLEGLVAQSVPEFEAFSKEQLAQLESQFREAIQLNEDMQRAALDIEIERKRLHIENRALRPKFDAELGLSSNALDVDGTRREQAYSYFGMSVGWRIFDGFRKKGRTLEVLSRLTAKERAREALEARLMQGFEQALRSLEIEQRSLAIQERLLEAEKGRVDWILKNVEAERMPQSEGEKAQREYLKIQLATQSARISYLVAVSQLATELGLDPIFHAELAAQPE